MRKQAVLVIAEGVIERLLDEARRAQPRECCGLLLGHDGRVEAALPAANVHPAPERHFEIDPQVLVDAHRTARGGGPQVIGYYHSHPSGVAVPSAEDAAQRAGDGRVWAIVAPGEAGSDVTFWRDDRAGFTALPARVHGG